MSDNRKASFTNDTQVYGSMDYRPAAPIKFTVPLNLPGWQPPAPGELPPPSMSPQQVERLIAGKKESAAEHVVTLFGPKADGNVLKTGTKYTSKFKQEAVALAILLRDKAGNTKNAQSFVKTCSKETGVPVQTLARWLKASDVDVPAMRTRHSVEFRNRVTARVLRPGANLGRIGMEEGVQRHTLMQWRSAARKAVKTPALTVHAEADDEPAHAPAKRVPMAGSLYALGRK